MKQSISKNQREQQKEVKELKESVAKMQREWRKEMAEKC